MLRDPCGQVVRRCEAGATDARRSHCSTISTNTQSQSDSQRCTGSHGSRCPQTLVNIPKKTQAFFDGYCCRRVRLRHFDGTGLFRYSGGAYLRGGESAGGGLCRADRAVWWRGSYSGTRVGKLLNLVSTDAHLCDSRRSVGTSIGILVADTNLVRNSWLSLLAVDRQRPDYRVQCDR